MSSTLPSTRSFGRTFRNFLAVGSLALAVGALATPVGLGAAPVPVTTDLGGFEGLATPIRIFDSRTGANPTPLVAGDNEITLTGVAATAPAIWINVTAVAPSVHTYLTVYGDVAMPPSSNVNVDAGSTRANLVVVRPVAGKIKIFNQFGTVHVAIDLLGYEGTAGATLRYNPFSPLGACRVFDTRPGQIGQSEGGPACFPSEPTMNLDRFESLAIPADVGTPVPAGSPITVNPAVNGFAVITLTALNATAPTYLTVYRGGLPLTSNLNLVPGEIVSNQVIVPADGDITIANNAGTVDVVIDVSGSFSLGEQTLFAGPDASRLSDTRTGIAPGKVTTQNIVVPGATVGSSAVVNLTVTEPTVAGYLLAYATGTSPLPTTSNLNFNAGETRAIQAIVPVDINGSITIATSGTTTHLVVDLVGVLMFADN